MKTRDEQITKLIALRLKQKRLHSGKEVTEAGNEAGISRSTLQNYEAGLRQPGLGVIRKLASVYRTSAAYLAGLTDYEGDSDSLAFSTADPFLSNKTTTLNDSIAFNSELLIKKQLSPGNLALIQSLDDLLDEVPKGSDVLIDTTVNEVKETDIYAFKSKTGEIFIRAARKEIGKSGFIIYATKDVHFPPVHVASEENENVEVFGRVVFVGIWR